MYAIGDEVRGVIFVIIGCKYIIFLEYIQIFNI
jgi:hypothetical protein